MNERIKELIEQATTKESFYPAGCGHHEDRYYFDKEKFAELIIKECAELMRNDPKYWKLLEHFGVEW